MRRFDTNWAHLDLRYVSEAQGTRVQILTSEGEYLATPLSILNAPHGITFDSIGTLYIADTMNELIRKLERDASEEGKLWWVAEDPS